MQAIKKVCPLLSPSLISTRGSFSNHSECQKQFDNFDFNRIVVRYLKAASEFFDNTLSFFDT